MDKNEVIKIVSVLENIFEISMWERTVVFEEKPSKEDEDVFADISVQHDYREYKLTIYPKFFTQNKNLQIKTLVHEFCHIPTFKLYENALNMAEGKIITKDQIHSSNEVSASWFEQIIYKALKNIKKKTG